MKWTYIIQQKMVASAVLFLLCLLVLFSNYIDRNHTDNVKGAISTLYEDRLIAEGYILKMTTNVYQIKELINADLLDAEKAKEINNLLSKIQDEEYAYKLTKFTDLEEEKADKLFSILNDFKRIHLDDVQEKLHAADRALVVLNDLSGIQLDVSKKIMEQADSLYQSGKTYSQFVFAIIIVILLVLQALVFTSKSLIPNVKPQFPNLN